MASVCPKAIVPFVYLQDWRHGFNDPLAYDPKRLDSLSARSALRLVYLICPLYHPSPTLSLTTVKVFLARGLRCTKCCRSQSAWLPNAAWRQDSYQYESALLVESRKTPFFHRALVQSDCESLRNRWPNGSHIRWAAFWRRRQAAGWTKKRDAPYDYGMRRVSGKADPSKIAASTLSTRLALEPTRADRPRR